MAVEAFKSHLLARLNAGAEFPGALRATREAFREDADCWQRELSIAQRQSEIGLSPADIIDGLWKRTHLEPARQLAEEVRRRQEAGDFGAARLDAHDPTDRVARLKQELHGLLVSNMNLAEVAKMEPHEFRSEVIAATEELVQLRYEDCSPADRDRMRSDILFTVFGDE